MSRVLAIAALSAGIAASATSAEAATSRALLIDTSVQPAGSSWTGAKLDDAVPSMRAVLAKRGFSELTTVAGPDATLPGLRDALAALVARAEPGDRVVVYYTGHGAQAPDDGRDEPDGLDELLVPYGAADDPAQYLRDDELGQALDALAARLGVEGHLLVILDACHSGSATRGHEDPGILLGRPIGGGLAARGAETGSGWDGAAPGAARAPTVVLAAARHDEPARWEKGRDGAAGVLTLALVPELEQAPADLTYRGLVARLAGDLERGGQAQHPQGEGAVDLPVLGGAGAQQPFFPVAAITATGAGAEVTLDGGQLAGLTLGSEIELAPAGARAPDGTGPRGRVRRIDATTAWVEVDRAPTGEGPFWGMVESFAPPAALRVTITAAAEKLAPDVRARLATVPGLAVVEADADWALVTEGKGKAQRLRLAPTAGDGAVDGPSRAGRDADWAAFLARVNALATTRAIRALRLDSAGWRLDLDPLVPPRTPDGACRTDAPPQLAEPDAEGRLVAAVGDAFALDVRYDGPGTGFVALVAFTPEGEALVLYPPEGDAGRTEPGDTFVYGVELCMQFTSPGTYVLRGQVTDRPVDLSWLAEAQGAARGEGLDVGALQGATAAVVFEVRGPP